MGGSRLIMWIFLSCYFFTCVKIAICVSVEIRLRRAGMIGSYEIVASSYELDSAY